MRVIGIFLVLAILAGGGFVYKKALDNSQTYQRVGTASSSQFKQTIDVKDSKSSSRVNINTANQDELESLPGIGPAKAKAIIDYRRKNGNFKSKRDIIKVKGIGEKTYEKIREKISIE